MEQGCGPNFLMIGEILIGENMINHQTKEIDDIISVPIEWIVQILNFIFGAIYFFEM